MNQRDKIDITEAIASVLAAHITDHGIIYGHETKQIVNIGYRDDDDEIVLRTSDEIPLVLRVTKIGGQIMSEAHAGHLGVTESYKRYKVMLDKWEGIRDYLSRTEQDLDIALQTFHDEMLDDDDRQDWDRWTVHATPGEWAIVRLQGLT